MYMIRLFIAFIAYLPLDGQFRYYEKVDVRQAGKVAVLSSNPNGESIPQMTSETKTLALPVKGILFDLDNTLFDRDLAFKHWASGFVEERFRGESEDQRAQVLKQIVTIDAHGYVTKHVLFSEVRALFPSITDDVEALCERFYQEWLVHMVLDADTESVLDLLDRTGTPFGIITNGPIQQYDKIRQLGLQHRTRCLFVSSEFGCHKPDPAIFRAAAVCLGVPCEQILFVGDYPHADICGAYGVGMQTAWMPCGAAWPADILDVKLDYTLHSLGDLLTLLNCE
jgi:HAD superfamily hydrolase (TIGR01549 family)